jgi:hypothetical protein
MKTVKEQVLAIYQKSSTDGKDSEPTKLDKVDFKTESETMMSWVESSIVEVDGKAQTTAMFKAYLLINEKVIFLLANSTPDQSLSKLQDQTSEWIQSIVLANK